MSSKKKHQELVSLLRRHAARTIPLSVAARKVMTMFATYQSEPNDVFYAEQNCLFDY